MLTVKQLLAITTRSSMPPWRVGDLRKIFKVQPTTQLSLRSVIKGVQGQQVVFFVEVRDASILKSVHTLAELQAIWKQSRPTKATWSQLSQILSSSGGSLKLLSNDLRKTGIAGTVDSLVGVHTIRITGDSLAGAEHIAEAAGAASILLIELGAEFGNPYLVVAGAALGAGDIAFLTALGIMELSSTEPGQVFEIPEVTIVGQPNPDPNTIQIPEVTIYGQIPAGVSPQDVQDAPATDPNTIPDTPPDGGADGGGP